MNTSVASSLKLALILGSIASFASAAPQSFDFKDPKGVNNIRFSLDAPLESITGTANGIAGTVHYDPAAPAKTTGHIDLDAASLVVGNPKMVEHLHGPYWLDVATYPTIRFELSKLSNIRNQGSNTIADATGMLTVKGVSKQVTVPVTFTYLADKLGARLGDDALKGDLLVLRAKFSINREDFDIQKGSYQDKVGQEIELSLSIAGAATQS